MTDRAAEHTPAMVAGIAPRLSVRSRLARRLRTSWDSVRPIQLPQYLPNPPHIGGQFAPGLIQGANLKTLSAAAMSEEAHAFVAGLLERLTPEGDITLQRAYYELSQAQFGKHWRYADVAHVLWAASTLIRPASYLEIGVMRGRSAATIAATAPDCDIYGFDLWVPDYAGIPNPGPDFVRKEVDTVGHRGALTLVSGDSATTVPAFLREHPDLYFDTILIDGGKSVVGVAADFANTLPRLKVGGIVLTDDLAMFPRLRRVWRTLVEKDSRYMTSEFTDVGYSVAVAVRVSDEPLLAVMNRG